MPPCKKGRSPVSFTILPLGCYGSDLEEKKCISMRLSPHLIIDAGAILSNMSKEDLLKIKHVVITHAHFDHVKDLPTLSDFMLSYGANSFTIHTTETIARQIQTNIFNDLIWPDFTKLPSKRTPTVTFRFFSFGEPFIIDDFEFLPIPVNHVVESVGFIIRHGGDSAGYSGDTHRCPSFVDAVNAEKNLRVLCWETSFPNRLSGIARNSRHLTPHDLEQELAMVAPQIPVWVFHMKPSMLEEIETELQEIKADKPVRFMRQKSPIIVG